DGARRVSWNLALPAVQICRAPRNHAKIPDPASENREYTSDRTGTRSPACDVAKVHSRHPAWRRELRRIVVAWSQEFSMKRPLCLFITPLIGVVAACTGPIEPPDGLIDDSGSPTRPGAVPTTPGGTSSPPSMNPGANPGSNPGSGTGSTSGMFPGSGTGSTTGNPGSVTGTGGTGSGIPPATGGSPSTPVVPGDPTVPEDPNTPDPPNPATS